MRIVFAASFVDDADAIARYIERQFGVSRADAFIDDLNRFCELEATQPRVGRQNHGYDTTLYGVVHDVNWIFFEHDWPKCGSFTLSMGVCARVGSSSE